MQRSRIGIHVGEQDVPVDVGQYEVVALAFDRPPVSEQRPDTVGHAVVGYVFARIAVGPVVYVDRIHPLCAAKYGQHGQHAGSASHVQTPLSVEPAVDDFGPHQVGRCMVTGTESHFRHDDQLVFGSRVFRMERRANAALALDVDRFEVRFPQLVPVPVLDRFRSVTVARFLQISVDPGDCSAIVRFADIGFQAVRFLAEGFERKVRQFGEQDFTSPLVGALYGHFDMVHRCRMVCIAEQK